MYPLLATFLLGCWDFACSQNVIWEPITETIVLTDNLLPYFNDTGLSYSFELCKIFPWKDLNSIIESNQYNYWYTYFQRWSYRPQNASTQYMTDTTFYGKFKI